MKRLAQFLIIFAIALSAPFLIGASGTESTLLLPLLLIILLIFSVVILVVIFIAAFQFGRIRGTKEESEEWENYVKYLADSQFERGMEQGIISGAEEALKDFTIIQKPLIKETGNLWWKELEITCKTELFYRGLSIKLEWKDEQVYKAKIDNFPQIEAMLDTAINLPGDLGKGNIKVEVKLNFETKELSQNQRQSLVDFLNGKYSNERKISSERSRNRPTTVDVTPYPPSLSPSKHRYMLPPSK